MAIYSFQPPAHLQDFIKEVYFCQFQEEDEQMIPVLDDCCHDIVYFKEANAHMIYGVNANRLEIPYQVFAIHELPPPFALRINQSLTFITIKLQPWCNHMFYPNMKAGGIFDVSDQFKSLISKSDFIWLFANNELKENIDRIFERLSLFCEKLQLNEQQVLLKEIVSYMYKENGNVRVEEIEEKFNLSRQYIRNLFKKHIFYSPKHFIGMLRVIQAVKLQVNTPEISMTALAHEVGYYDQAHFIRDFKRVAGLTPKKFFNASGLFFQRHKKSNTLI